MSTINPTFKQAINASMLWCIAWENEELSDEVLADRVAELLETRDGARGFFVISLASDCPLMDRLPDPLLVQLRAAGGIVIDLTVRNLAMSTAKAVEHKRKGDIAQQACSERITARTIELLRLLEPNQVKSRLEILLEATSNSSGSDMGFISEQGYDNEQKLAITSTIYKVADN